MSRKFFGTDGIRGRTNAWPMTAELAMKIGMAAGAHFQRGTHRSEEHTSELQSLMRISYAVFCLKKKIYANNEHINVDNSYDKIITTCDNTSTNNTAQKHTKLIQYT